MSSSSTTWSDGWRGGASLGSGSHLHPESPALAQCQALTTKVSLSWRPRSRSSWSHWAGAHRPRSSRSCPPAECPCAPWHCGCGGARVSEELGRGVWDARRAQPHAEESQDREGVVAQASCQPGASWRQVDIRSGLLSRPFATRLSSCTGGVQAAGKKKEKDFAREDMTLLATLSQASRTIS